MQGQSRLSEAGPGRPDDVRQQPDAGTAHRPVELTREEWADRTVDARRLARFKRLKERAQRTIDGEPKLTAGQLRALSDIFRAASDGQESS